MKASATAFTLFSVNITWLHLLIGCSILFVLYIVFGLIREKTPRISLKTAFRDALRTAAAQPAALVKFLLTEACVIVICLTPLLLLTEKMPLWIPAALAAVCWFLLMNPARVNAAAAMQDSLGNGSVFSMRLADPSRWFSKVRHGVLRAAFLACWSVPLAAGLGYAYRFYKGTDDISGPETLHMVQDFGNGDVRLGIKYLLLILGGLILILMIGFAFHSGARHALALGRPRLVNGHRGKIALGWFCSVIVFMLPLWIALGIVISRFMPMLNDPRGIFTVIQTLHVRPLLLILGAGTLLTLPLIPVRSLMIAAMVHQLKDREESAAS